MSDSAQDDDATATTTAGAEVTDEVAEAVEASAQPADLDETASEAADLDDTKRKFREALERKRQANTREATSTGGRGTVKGKGAQGPATSRRSFRRKSG